MNKNPHNELFVSVDIEADGPIPIKNSMLSIGAVPFTSKEVLPERFEANLFRMNGAVEDPDTMEWWSTQPEAWKALQENRVLPIVAMAAFDEWLQSLYEKYHQAPIFAGFPAGYDYTFVHVYSHWFLGHDTLGIKAWDAKTYAAALLKKSYKDSVKSKFPQEWFNGDIKHTHKAIDDALGQAYMMQSMLNFNLKG